MAFCDTPTSWAIGGSIKTLIKLIQFFRKLIDIAKQIPSFVIFTH